MECIIPEVLIMSMFDTPKDSLTIDVSKFQKAFYHLKKEPEFKDVMREIKFRGSPASPYSEDLDEALSNLQYIHVLSRKNPDLVEYMKAEKFTETWEKLRNGYNVSIQSLISKIGEIIVTSL
ncbi:MAG: hypothetical protein JEY71_16790 [Sphaerochaeta sp.]|nr:hypothetical protein [Sphaerochaeta sp.]